MTRHATKQEITSSNESEPTETSWELTKILELAGKDIRNYCNFIPFVESLSKDSEAIKKDPSHVLTPGGGRTLSQVYRIMLNTLNSLQFCQLYLNRAEEKKSNNQKWCKSNF